MELTATQTPDVSNQTRIVESILAKLLSPRPEFEFVSSGSLQREEVEGYVSKKFKAAYGANIHEFMPSLLSMRCLGNLSGVAGLRPAANHSLFLEQYLDETIELELQKNFGYAVTRESIVEIGNLAASKRGASQLVFLVFTAMLSAAGYKWIVFSATTSLRGTLNKLGFETQVIKKADPARLQTTKLDEWGSYYQSEPMVVVGSLENAIEIIQERPLFRKVMHCYKSRIEVLASEFNRAA